MIIVNCEQGDETWTQSRAGVITASMFSTIRAKVNCLDERQARYVAEIKSGKTESEAMLIAGYKAKPNADGIKRALAGESVGEYSDTTKNYAFRLAIERISGTSLDEGFETWSMKRGHELEPVARMEHELLTGCFVERTGFVLTDDRKFGASADGLIDDDGGSEYKCLIAPDRLRTVLIDNDISEFKDQIQGCMWITKRAWWHFGLYCPALELINKQFYLQHVNRDEVYIKAMEADLLEFEKLVSQYEQQLRKTNELALPNPSN